MGLQAATSLLMDGDEQRRIGWLCKIRDWADRPSKAKSSTSARTSKHRDFIGRNGMFRHGIQDVYMVAGR